MITDKNTLGYKLAEAAAAKYAAEGWPAAAQELNAEIAKHKIVRWEVWEIMDTIRTLIVAASAK